MYHAVKTNPVCVMFDCISANTDFSETMTITITVIIEMHDISSVVKMNAVYICLC